jgi:chitinase/chitodextrinase
LLFGALPVLFSATLGCESGRQDDEGQPLGRTVEALATSRTMVGYWHNFDNKISTPPFRLNAIPSAWDVVVVAFAEDAGGGSIRFALDTSSGLTIADFKADVLSLQAQGKKVVLSLGGEKGTVTLNTSSDEANFVSSLNTILSDYKFDGLDIDLESGAGVQHGSQIQTRIVSAVTSIASTYESANPGKDFYLSMAPEHPYVHGAVVAYTGIWGSYIPMIEGLRSELDLIHVQLYNNGGLQTPYANSAYAVGSVDNLVAAQLMLIRGFTCAGGHQFVGLRPDQVAIGVPTGPGASNDGSQFTTANLIKALDCLTLGTNCGAVKPGATDPSGGVYWPSGTTYADFRGAMTWSINWDEKLGRAWSTAVGNYLHTTSGDTTAPSTPGGLAAGTTSATSVPLTWTAATDNVAVTGYKIFRSTTSGGTYAEIGQSTSTSYTDTSAQPTTTYYYTVAARDAAGNTSSQSSYVSATTATQSDAQKPSIPSGLTAGTIAATSVPLSWTASTDNVGVAGYRVFRGATPDTVVQIADLPKPAGGSAPTSYTDAAASPNTTYVYRVSAYDAAGNASDLSSGLAVTTPSTGGSCSASAFVRGSTYAANAEVSNIGCTTAPNSSGGACPTGGLPQSRKYKCLVAGWCSMNNDAYDPGTGWAWENAWAFVSDCSGTPSDTTAPTVPAGLSATKTTTSVTLSWTASTDSGGSGLKEYRVFRGATQVATSTSSGYTDNGLTPNTTYAYSVAAVDNAGNVSGQSTSLNVTTNAASDTAAPSIPSGLVAGTVGTTSVTFSWSASTDNVGVTGYDVYRNGTKIGTSISTSYTDGSASANTAYNYTVSAKDAAGNTSGQSSALAVTTAGATSGCGGLTEWAGAQSSACYYPSLSSVSYKGKKYTATDANCMHAYCVPDGSGGYGACGWALVGTCN